MPVIINTAPARPTAGVSLGVKGRGTGSPVVVSFVGAAEEMTVGKEPGTSLVKSAGADVGRGATFEEGSSDVAAVDCCGCETVDDGAALASSLIPGVTAAEVGTAKLVEASCLSSSIFLPWTAAVHKEYARNRPALMLRT
jgi:hypothetical protein